MLWKKDHHYYANILDDDRVKTHTTLDFEVNAGDVIIWDEGDEMLFNCPTEFVKRMGAARCNIVLTASAFATKDGVEALIMKQISMKVINF